MSHPQRRFGLLFVIVLMLFTVPARAQDEPSITATPATPISTLSLDPTEVAPADDPLTSVIVKLVDPPLAAYRGGVPGLGATSPAATGQRLDPDNQTSARYRAYLDQKMQSFEAKAQAAIPRLQVTARYHQVLGGVAVVLPQSQVSRIATLSGVAEVLPDERRSIDTDRSPQFIGADVIWQALTADPALGDGGEGVIVGVIDSGIWPEHPSFADDGSYSPPPDRWRGSCAAPRDASPVITCTNKLIGAQAFLDTYRLRQGLGPGEFDSARDNDGHGTHTASTAAGNANVSATLLGVSRGTVSGIAPRAYVAAYKALGALGGYTSDLVAAIDKAVADGVDVINYSIGSTADPDPYGQADALAFLDAYQAGVFVAVAAGNSGPNANTIGSPANAPWVMSVAASTTDQRYVGTFTMRAGDASLSVSGASITGGVADKRVLTAAALGDARCERRLPAVVSDTIVLCARGGNTRVEKSAVVRASGGAGMVLYNTTPQDVFSDNHLVPTVHIDAPQTTEVLSFTNVYSTALIIGEIVSGTATLDPASGDIMATFSSRGPLDSAQRGISKPDITAPGVQILAGNTPAPNDPSAGPTGELFQAIAGTSMAAPHIAGSAALLRALHPAWSPGQIKSALMTSALTTVRKPDGVTPADPFDMGSGRVDLTRAGDPGLTFDISAEVYASGKQHLADLNYPSISVPSMPGKASVSRVVRSELASDSVWEVSAEAPAGVTMSVAPAQLSIPAHGYASFSVTIDAGVVPTGTYFGRVLLRNGERVAGLPVNFSRTTAPTSVSKRCDPPSIALNSRTACTLSTVNNSSEEVRIAMRDIMPAALPIDAATVQGAQLVSPTNTLQFSGRLPGVRKPTVHVNAIVGDTHPGYVSLAGLGVPPIDCSEACDEDAATFIAPAFSYGGQTYDRVTMVTNGYLIIGNARYIARTNQAVPSVVVPNNFIAPYWTDFDLDGTSTADTGGGRWYAAYVNLRGNPNQWFVAEWADVARAKADPTVSRHTFQVWIESGSDRIYIVYGPNSAAEDAFTVGAENADGSVGGAVYVDISRDGIVNGTGTPPIEGNQFTVTTTPEVRSSHVVSYEAIGAAPGVYTTTVELEANSFTGTSVTTATVTVTP